MTTFKMPEPVAYIDRLQATTLKTGCPVVTTLTTHRAFKEDEPLYTADALRDVLEQAAMVCESLAVTDCSDSNIARHECAAAIRAMKEQIKLTESTDAPNMSKTTMSDERIMEVARRHWKLPGNDVIAFVRELLG